MPGGVLSTVKVALGPAPGAWLVELDAVFAEREMPRVPFPEMLESVTVRDDNPEPLTLTVAVAVPVAFNVTLAAESVMLLA